MKNAVMANDEFVGRPLTSSGPVLPGGAMAMRVMVQPPMIAVSSQYSTSSTNTSQPQKSTP